MNQTSVAMRIDEGKAGSVAILNPLVQEITDALLELGGAAHRDLVVSHVAKKRGIFRPPASMAQELDAAFSTYCGDARSTGLLYLPYGPSSRRWALTEQAFGMLRADVGSGAR